MNWCSLSDCTCAIRYHNLQKKWMVPRNLGNRSSLTLGRSGMVAQQARFFHDGSYTLYEVEPRSCDRSPETRSKESVPERDYRICKECKLLKVTEAHRGQQP